MEIRRGAWSANWFGGARGVGVSTLYLNGICVIRKQSGSR